MRTAIVGRFLRGKLLEGDHRGIIGYRYVIPIGIVIDKSILEYLWQIESTIMSRISSGAKMVY